MLSPYNNFKNIDLFIENVSYSSIVLQLFLLG